MEMSITLVLLAAALVAVGTFSSAVKKGLYDRELSERVGMEVLNFREEIGSWEYEAITSDRIESTPVPDLFHNSLQDAQWEAKVSELEAPLVTKQITLTLSADYLGQVVRPQQMTFWVVKQVDDADSGESKQTSPQPREDADDA